MSNWLLVFNMNKAFTENVKQTFVITPGMPFLQSRKKVPDTAGLVSARIPRDHVINYLTGSMVLYTYN